MSEPGLILTVCTANICRSPMASALLEHALRAQPDPLKSLRILSAGVSARDGEKVSANSVETMQKVGLDIAGHTSQRLTLDLVTEALAIYVMTESHRAMINLMFEPPPGTFFFSGNSCPGKPTRKFPIPTAVPSNTTRPAATRWSRPFPPWSPIFRNWSPPGQSKRAILAGRRQYPLPPELRDRRQMATSIRLFAIDKKTQGHRGGSA